MHRNETEQALQPKRVSSVQDDTENCEGAMWQSDTNIGEGAQ